ncbi:twin-arginine translocase TatA/TatE family subunit [Jiangella mangrovi]|uniref:Sec-independent protein translocase protein TatB n=1 Tax=Jiangella mangrovi TaxID=1524084 RepID=A0A7W9GLB8_9ACTN|nr:Tat protein translocase TatB subunit [Jiangella mangrovi]
MFDIGIGEVFVLLVVALLVFGPDRLPEMAKQTAGFVRDLRTMVANARKDLSGSVGDLGIDKEDLKTLSDLRNPKSFVRSKVLDGIDLGLDDDGASSNGVNGANGTRPSTATTGTEHVGEVVDVPPPSADVPPPPDDEPDADFPPPPMEETPEGPPPAAEEPVAEPVSEPVAAESSSDEEQVPVNAEASRSPRFDPDAT